jgi:hypothetical protein
MTWLDWFTSKSKQEKLSSAEEEGWESRLSEPERRIDEQREVDAILDFLKRTEQTLLGTASRSDEIFYTQLQQIHHNHLVFHWLEDNSEEVQFSAVAPMGSVQWRVTLRSLQPPQLVTSLPKVVMRLQSRRHHRVVALNTKRYFARLFLSSLDAGVELINLSEEGACWASRQTHWQRGQVLTSCRFELSKEVISIPALRVVNVAEGGAGRVRIGVQFHGVSEPDRRFMRRWLAEAEVSTVSFSSYN